MPNIKIRNLIPATGGDITSGNFIASALNTGEGHERVTRKVTYEQVVSGGAVFADFSEGLNVSGNPVITGFRTPTPDGGLAISGNNDVLYIGSVEETDDREVHIQYQGQDSVIIDSNNDVKIENNLLVEDGEIQGKIGRFSEDLLVDGNPVLVATPPVGGDGIGIGGSLGDDDPVSLTQNGETRIKLESDGTISFNNISNFKAGATFDPYITLINQAAAPGDSESKLYNKDGSLWWEDWQIAPAIDITDGFSPEVDNTGNVGISTAAWSSGNFWNLYVKEGGFFTDLTADNLFVTKSIEYSSGSKSRQGESSPTGASVISVDDRVFWSYDRRHFRPFRSHLHMVGDDCWAYSGLGAFAYKQGSSPFLTIDTRAGGLHQDRFTSTPNMVSTKLSDGTLRIGVQVINDFIGYDATFKYSDDKGFTWTGADPHQDSLSTGASYTQKYFGASAQEDRSSWSIDPKTYDNFLRACVKTMSVNATGALSGTSGYIGGIRYTPTAVGLNGDFTIEHVQADGAVSVVQSTIDPVEIGGTVTRTITITANFDGDAITGEDIDEAFAALDDDPWVRVYQASETSNDLEKTASATDEPKLHRAYAFPTVTQLTEDSLGSFRTFYTDMGTNEVVDQDDNVIGAYGKATNRHFRTFIAKTMTMFFFHSQKYAGDDVMKLDKIMIFGEYVLDLLSYLEHFYVVLPSDWDHEDYAGKTFGFDNDSGVLESIWRTPKFAVESQYDLFFYACNTNPASSDAYLFLRGLNTVMTAIYEGGLTKDNAAEWFADQREEKGEYFFIISAESDLAIDTRKRGIHYASSKDYSYSMYWGGSNYANISDSNLIIMNGAYIPVSVIDPANENETPYNILNAGRFNTRIGPKIQVYREASYKRYKPTLIEDGQILLTSLESGRQKILKTEDYVTALTLTLDYTEIDTDLRDAALEDYSHEAKIGGSEEFTDLDGGGGESANNNASARNNLKYYTTDSHLGLVVGVGNNGYSAQKSNKVQPLSYSSLSEVWTNSLSNGFSVASFSGLSFHLPESTKLIFTFDQNGTFSSDTLSVNASGNWEVDTISLSSSFKVLTDPRYGDNVNKIFLGSTSDSSYLYYISSTSGRYSRPSLQSIATISVAGTRASTLSKLSPATSVHTDGVGVIESAAYFAGYVDYVPPVYLSKPIILDDDSVIITFPSRTGTHAPSASRIHKSSRYNYSLYRYSDDKLTTLLQARKLTLNAENYHAAARDFTSGSKKIRYYAKQTGRQGTLITIAHVEADEATSVAVVSLDRDNSDGYGDQTHAITVTARDTVDNTQIAQAISNSADANPLVAVSSNTSYTTGKFFAFEARNLISDNPSNNAGPSPSAIFGRYLMYTRNGRKSTDNRRDDLASHPLKFYADCLPVRIPDDDDLNFDADHYAASNINGGPSRKNHEIINKYWGGGVTNNNTSIPGVYYEDNEACIIIEGNTVSDQIGDFTISFELRRITDTRYGSEMFKANSYVRSGLLDQFPGHIFTRSDDNVIDITDNCFLDTELKGDASDQRVGVINFTVPNMDTLLEDLAENVDDWITQPSTYTGSTCLGTHVDDGVTYRRYIVTMTMTKNTPTIADQTESYSKLMLFHTGTKANWEGNVVPLAEGDEPKYYQEQFTWQMLDGYDVRQSPAVGWIFGQEGYRQSIHSRLNQMGNKDLVAIKTLDDVSIKVVGIESLKGENDQYLYDSTFLEHAEKDDYWAKPWCKYYSLEDSVGGTATIGGVIYTVATVNDSDSAGFLVDGEPITIEHVDANQDLAVVEDVDARTVTVTGDFSNAGVGTPTQGEVVTLITDNSTLVTAVASGLDADDAEAADATELEITEGAVTDHPDVKGYTKHDSFKGVSGIVDPLVVISENGTIFTGTESNGYVYIQTDGSGNLEYVRDLRPPIPELTSFGRWHYVAKDDIVFVIQSDKLYYAKGQDIIDLAERHRSIRPNWIEADIGSFTPKAINYLAGTEEYYLVGTNGLYLKNSTGTGTWTSPIEPQYSFSSQPRTGLYKDLNHDLHLVFKGESLVSLDDQGITLTQGQTKLSVLDSNVTISKKLGINTSEPDTFLTIKGDIAEGADETFISFLDSDNTELGGIKTTDADGTLDLFSVSDYRLKTNISDFEKPIERLMSLRPCSFEWSKNNVASEGFIAHEVQQVVPNAVTGEKDSIKTETKIIPAEYKEMTFKEEVINEETNEVSVETVVKKILVQEARKVVFETPVYQGVAYSKIVPLLTAALQETIKEVQVLKKKIDELENQ